MKKILAACSIALLAGSLLFAGGGKQKAGSPGAVKIGVLQLVEHPALDAAYKGFVDELAAKGYVNGKNITIDYQNAQGDQSNCVTIAQKLVNEQCALILAIATPAAQAVANLTKSIPILVTAVTDPQSAKLVQSNDIPGTNVSGTSDLTPVAKQIDLLHTLVPTAKTVGFLYSSSEQNSKFQIEIAKKECAKLGLKYIEGTPSNSNEVQQVVQSVTGKVDAIYIPTDNLMASSMPTIIQTTMAAKIPVIGAEEAHVKAGALATYGINYYKLGEQTGDMAVEILKDHKKPADMPIEYLKAADLKVNKDSAAKLGITIPADLK
jgi:putative ABC transport system substrate-binding protein